MSRYPKITSAGDRLDAVKDWTIAVVVVLVLAWFGPVLVLGVIDLVGRWIR
ncbi:hypothetical protein ACIBCH_20850 [Amycolatopsis thailandensis]|uniref:hypothetical protein n=1 Tax=Amycolatopsis thailandensis TaxID=589330 RepID=UPI0037BA431D